MWAKSIEAFVIGSVLEKENEQSAYDYGCGFVLVQRGNDIDKAFEELGIERVNITSLEELLRRYKYFIAFKYFVA